MDPRIINDTFGQEQHICSKCECPTGNHLIFHICPLFDGTAICQECCQIGMMKDDVDLQVSAKLGRVVTKEFINNTCKNCGLNNACQNKELANKLEKGITGDSNGNGPTQPNGPQKTR